MSGIANFTLDLVLVGTSLLSSFLFLFFRLFHLSTLFFPRYLATLDYNAPRLAKLLDFQSLDGRSSEDSHWTAMFVCLLLKQHDI